MFRSPSIRPFWRFTSLVAAGVCASLSCNNAPAPPVVTSGSATVAPATLVFDTPQLKERFNRFDSLTRELAKKEGDWKHRDYTQGGNFVTAIWAKGAGYDDDCRLSREPKHQVGIHRIEVDTIVVGGTAKSAALTIERVDASPQEWSVLCNYREATEQSVTGAGWRATVFKWDAGRQHTYIPFRPYEQTTAKFDLGPRYGYQVQDTRVEVVTDLSQEDSFLLYLKSPESLRDAWLSANKELLRKVEETIASHEVQKRVFGKYAGDGKPPPSHVELLTPAEEEAELAKARQHFTQLQQLVQDEHEAIHAALRKAFPFEKCWSELKPRDKRPPE